MAYCAERLDIGFADRVLQEQGAFVGGRWAIDQARIDERFIVEFVARGKPR